MAASMEPTPGVWATSRSSWALRPTAMRAGVFRSCQRWRQSRIRRPDVRHRRRQSLELTSRLLASNKQNAVIRLGSRRDMTAPVWEGITLIPDSVTLADKGQIKITAVMLHAVKILREAGFYKQQLQHA